ncbi:MAG: hypothetical protein GXP28_02990 [Planctomycetes bacterium]|nr:hypothetical protein [Planctomycetota bacterium]
MSSSAIDQVLQLAPTVRSTTDLVQPTVSGRPAFQDHLERASSKTLPPEDAEPLDTDGNDLTSADEQHDAASSQEEETSIATEAVATDEDHDSKEEPEQDAVELSNSAVALADVQIATENEEVVVLQQPEPTNENTNAEENEHSDGSTPAEQPVVLTDIKGEPTRNQQQTEKTAKDIDPAKGIEVQPKVVSKTPERPSGELEADVRQKNQTAERAVQTTPAEPSTSEEQPTKQTAQAEEQDFTPPGDQKPGQEKSGQEKPTRQDSNSQPIATKTEAPPSGKILALDEPSTLATESRPSVAVSAPVPESVVPLAHSGGEDASVLQRSTGTSVAASAAASAEAEPAPTADRARFVQRVSGAIRSAQSREGEIHLQLRPPELGSLRIEIVVKQGVLTAQLETETSAARAILLDNLPALRERLAEQEIRIEKFDVNVRDEGGQQPDHPGTEDRKANRPPIHEARASRAENQQETETTHANLESTTKDVRI